MIPVIFSATMLIEGARQIGQAATATPAEAQAPQTWVAAFYMIAVLLIGQIGIWIREFVKYRDFKSKNGELAEIKKQATSAADKATTAAAVAIETKAIIGLIQTNCNATTGRMARAIEANTSRIVDIATQKKD